MPNQFKVLTLSYKNAPIDIREMVSLNENACRNLLEGIKEFTPVREALVLSTCNRTEIYYVADKDYNQEMLKLLAMQKGFIGVKKITPYFRHITEANLAVQHLFRVTLGLESQVAGDMQIMNQVKHAYQWAADAEMAGPFLHRLLHTIFFANKRVANETSFRDGAASVAYATVELVEELTKNIPNPRVLMIGLGDIGATVCRNFVKTDLKNVVITNRTYNKAVALAEECNQVVAPWETVWDEIKAADVVISSVPGDCFFIGAAAVANQEITPKSYIDLSMPRSIDSAIAQLPGASVHNIDSIRNRATVALEKRLAAVPQVEVIISEAMAEFNAWTKEMAISPAVQQFKNTLEQIRQQEIARYMKNLGAVEKDLLEEVTRNILQKIVKLPVLELKAACQRGESETLIEGLQALFNLEKQTA
ncbi:glutamyl-tRNA reductase [Adhaeribacter aerolatus]|uniref:Glutamyl-tRNA reductase n=1 Tax=Adhaeribacter aerolatus TaxID=670289 RepID=A0A512ASX6_9BACT|nr:glutamyl-tRNA reductase [Adhaeribacter aerolatus]GEO02687.1 glutamyl-tRNA reductase [Adhaeribacter aerolatus]